MNDEEYYKMIEELKNSSYVLMNSEQEKIVFDAQKSLMDAKQLILQISKIPDHYIDDNKIKELEKLVNNMITLDLVTEINSLIQ